MFNLKKYPLGIVFCLIIFQFFSLNAQKSLINQNPLLQYQKAQRLFDEKMYASSYEEFSILLETDFQKLSKEQQAEASYKKAICSLELMQNDAESLLDQFSLQYPWHPKVNDAKFYLSRFYFKRKNYKKTIISLEKLDVYELEDKNREEAIFMNAYSLYKENKIDEAFQKFSQIKDSKSSDGLLAAYYYGLISYEQGKYQEALKEFIKLEKERKFSAYIPLYISNIYLQLNNYDKVIEQGEKAIQDTNSIKSVEIMANIADAYYQKKLYTKAQDKYNAVIQNGGILSPSQTYQAGISYIQAEQYSKGIELLSQLDIKKDSLGQNITWHIANSYLKLDNKNKAWSGFQYASTLKFDKKIEELSLINYAKLSMELKFEKEAIEAYKQFLNKYPKSKFIKESKENLSNLLLSSNNPKEAIEVLESMENRSDKLNEAYQKVLFGMGIDYLKDKNYSEAESYFIKSLKNPEDKKTKALCYFWIGEISYKLSNYQKAQSNYKNFLFIPESGETQYFNLVNYNIAYTYFKQEDYFYANTYFTKYLKGETSNNKTPRAIDAQLRSADCAFMQKNYSEASSGYQQVIDAKTPEGDYAAYQKGIILGVQKKSNEKVSVLRAMVRKYPNSSYLDDALFAIADELKNQDKTTEAIDAYNYLNTNYPKNPYYRAAILNIGLIYYNNSQDAKALVQLKNIVKVYPFSDEAKTAKKQIENIYIENQQTDSLEAFLNSIPNANLVNTSVDSLLYASAFSSVKAGNCESVIKTMSKYIEKYPENGYYSVDARFYRGECAWKLKNIKTAIEDYNFVINRSPNQYLEKSLKASGSINYSEGNFEMASKRYEQLEDYTGSNENIILSLSGQMRSFFRIKRWDKAAPAANRLINLAYAEPELKLEAEYYLGKINQELKQYDQASSYYQKVYKSLKNEFGAEAVYQSADMLFFQEKYTESEDLIYYLNDNFSQYGFWRAKAFILLGDIYTKKGDYFTAKNTLQSIIDNYKGEDITNIAKQKMEEIKKLESQMNDKKKEAKENE